MTFQSHSRFRNFSKKLDKFLDKHRKRQRIEPPHVAPAQGESSSFGALLFQVPEPIQSEESRNFSKSQSLYIERRLYTNTRTSLLSSVSQSVYRGSEFCQVSEPSTNSFIFLLPQPIQGVNSEFIQVPEPSTYSFIFPTYFFIFSSYFPRNSSYFLHIS